MTAVTTVPRPAERTAWLAERHPYFNASDTGVLYGCHPFRTAADVAAEKLQPAPPDAAPTEAMDRGNRLEGALLDWFADRHGCEVVIPDQLYVSGSLMATPDGLTGDAHAVVQAKTTSDRWDSPPSHVYWQIVAECACTGRPQGWCVWLDADMAYKDALIVPPRGDVEDVLQRAESFMSWIALGMVPEGIELTAGHVAALHPKPETGSFVDVDDDGLAAIVRWEQARQARLAAEKDEDAARDVVARLLGNKAEAHYDGHTVLTWKASKESPRTDHKAAALKYCTPQQLAEFTKSKPGARTMRATKELGQ